MPFGFERLNNGVGRAVAILQAGSVVGSDKIKAVYKDGVETVTVFECQSALRFKGTCIESGFKGRQKAHAVGGLISNIIKKLNKIKGLKRFVY